MNILAIGAHPDDIEYGCGGMLLKCVKKGYNVYFLVLTEGEAGGEAAVRKKEQEETACLLGVKKVFWGGFKDTEIPVNRETISAIEKVVKEIVPDEIYVNYFKDTHQDHRALSRSVISATRNAPKVFFYEDYTTTNFHPNVFVDIGDVIEEKTKLLGHHRSQVKKAPASPADVVESVIAVAVFRGFQAKVKYAEGFKVQRLLKDV